MQLNLHLSRSGGALLALMLLGCERRSLEVPDAEFWALAVGDEDKLTLFRPPFEALDLGKDGEFLWLVEFDSDPVHFGLEVGGHLDLTNCDPQRALEIDASRVWWRQGDDWELSELPEGRRCLAALDLSYCWSRSSCASSIAGDGVVCGPCGDVDVQEAVRPSPDCPVDWIQYTSDIGDDIPDGFAHCRPNRWDAGAPSCDESRLAHDRSCAAEVVCDAAFGHVSANGRPTVRVAAQAELDQALSNLEPDSLILISAPSVVVGRISQSRVEFAGVCPAQTAVTFATDIADKEIALTSVSVRQTGPLQITNTQMLLYNVDWSLAAASAPETAVDFVGGRLQADGLRFFVRATGAALRVASTTVAITNAHFDGDASLGTIIECEACSLDLSSTVFRSDAESNFILGISAMQARSIYLSGVDFLGVRRGVFVDGSTLGVVLEDIVGDFHTLDVEEQPPGLFAFYNVPQTTIEGLYCQTTGPGDSTACVEINNGEASIKDLSTGRVGSSIEFGSDANVDIERMWADGYLQAGLHVPMLTPRVSVTLDDAFLKSIDLKDVEANGGSVRGGVGLRSIGVIVLSRVWIVSHSFHGVAVRAGSIKFADLTIENGYASAINTVFDGHISGARLHVRNVRRGLQLKSSANFELEDVLVEPVTSVVVPDPSTLLNINPEGGMGSGISNFRFEGVTPNRLDFAFAKTNFVDGVFQGVELAAPDVDGFDATLTNVGYVVTE